MAATGEELRVPIGIPVQTNAGEAADSVQLLRDKLAQSKDVIKQTATALRDLRGNSDQVKAAKDQLRATLDAEKVAVTQATLKLLEQGSGYDKVKDKAKEATKATEKATAATKKEATEGKKSADVVKDRAKAFESAIAAAGGPVAALKGKLETLKDLLGGTEGGMVAVAGGAALAAAAIVAVGAGAAAAAISLAKFIIVSADSLRLMQLTRKANLNGNDSWAKNLGDQIDDMARRMPVAKEKLNELGISLAKSRIGGQTMVDTMNAVAGATAAAGDDLGNKLKGIVERGAFTKRFQLSPQELLGMDLDFNEVAAAYSDGMHISVEAARKALFEGRVKLADGAAALRRAVDAKFGGINADKMLGLDNQLEKFKKDLAALTKDVNLDPILKSIQKLAFNFDQASVNGRAMKGIITTIGRSLGASFEEGTPILQDFIDNAVLGALKMENYWLRASIAFKSFTGQKIESAALDQVLNILKGVGEVNLGPVAIAAVTVSVAAKAMGAAWGGVKDDVSIAKEAILGLNADILAIDWKKTGFYVVKGLNDGIVDGAKKLVDTVKGLADDVKNAFTEKLKIQSPSKVFAGYGQQTVAGFEQGVDASSSRATMATANMATAAAAGGASAASSASSGIAAGGRTSIVFSPNIIVQGGGGDLREQLRDPALLQPLTEQFLAMLRTGGIEVPA